MNHYEVLEVSHSASPEVIRAAYRSLMQRFHPDKNPGDQAIGERAAAIAAAYEVLSNVDKRAEYDRHLQMAQNHAVTVARPGSAAAYIPPARSAPRSSARPGVWRWLFPVVAAVLIGAFAGLKTRTDPRAELAAIKESAASKATAEAPRRELHTPTIEVPERNPESVPAASPDAARERAQRTFVLLEGKMVVKVGYGRDTTPQGASAMQGELTLHGISLLVGTVAAPEVLALMDFHKQQLIRDLVARLAKEDLALFMGSDRQAHLKRVVKESVAATLATTSQGTYPSSTESTGHGVVDVLLPGNFETAPDKVVPAEPGIK